MCRRNSLTHLRPVGTSISKGHNPRHLRPCRLRVCALQLRYSRLQPFDPLRQHLDRLLIRRSLRGLLRAGAYAHQDGQQNQQHSSRSPRQGTFSFASNENNNTGLHPYLLKARPCTATALRELRFTAMFGAQPICGMPISVARERKRVAGGSTTEGQVKSLLASSCPCQPNIDSGRKTGTDKVDRSDTASTTASQPA